jgi:FlaA1/EpsC-like NDP-sugar epimerase
MRSEDSLENYFAFTLHILQFPVEIGRQKLIIYIIPLLVLSYVEDKTVVASCFNRFLFFFLSDILIVCLSLYLSILTHFEFDWGRVDFGLLGGVFFYFLVLKISALVIFRVYKLTWRYAGLSDLANIFLALFTSELMLVMISLPSNILPYLSLTGLSKRIFFIDGILSFCLIGALRVSKRFYLEIIREKGPTCKGQNTLIIGAGNTGEMILRDMIKNSFRDFYPIGFLDDNQAKSGSLIHGVKVLGKTSQMMEMISKHKVEAVIIAIASLNHKSIRKFYDFAQKANVKTIKIVPRIYDFGRPEINMKSLESISIEDLIGRQSIHVDYESIGAFIKGRAVLVTGAGGSIGSEIVVQICSFQPERVIAFDIDETELHNLGLKLSRQFSSLKDRIAYVTGDVRDDIRVHEVFDKWKPEIVFHAAAYKHVPMMEYNPKEAVKVNMFGTYIVAGAAKSHCVDKFIMISTDKAVRPTSVMGATKRMAEYICSAFNNEKPAGSFRSESTRFVSVRFGNVLGSRGSVLPLFLEQLKHGGPLTVTGREMQRYFMTIPEAVSLVLQASVLGNGGEVFVLDMGDPVRIVDIAEELIRLHGMDPYKDVDIQFIPPRPGEKLFEEILTAEEGTEASRHEKIFIAINGTKYPLAQIPLILQEFSALIADSSCQTDEVKTLLGKYVKYYSVAPRGDSVELQSHIEENTALDKHEMTA